MERLLVPARRFFFGFFLAFGFLALTNAFLGWPRSFEVAALLAVVGGASALATYAAVRRRDAPG